MPHVRTLSRRLADQGGAPWRLLCAATLSLALGAGCAPNRLGGDPADDPTMTDPPPQVAGVLTITPNPIDLVVGANDQAVRLTIRSSSLGDVSRTAALSLSDPSLGFGKDGTLTIRGGLKRGGEASLSASYGIQSGTAVVRVKAIAPDLVDPSAPPGAAGHFTAGGGTAPSLVYPMAQTLYPRNIAQLNFQWTTPSGAKAYRLRFTAPTFEQNVYLGPSACPSATTCQYQLKDDDFVNILRSVAGSAVSITVAQSAGPGQPYGETAPLQLSVSPEDVRGGLYYWSTSIQGIYRVPIGASKAQVFVNSAARGCAGCHSVSRDGKKVALQFGGPGGGAIIDGADANKVYVAPSAKGSWNLQTFNPSGDLLMINYNTAARIIRTDTGEPVRDVPMGIIGGKMAQPEWSPDGNSIVFVRYPQEGSGVEWNATSVGDIMVMPYNNGNFGPPQMIMASVSGREYHWYPSWTPDSQWIVFITGTVPCQGGSGCNTYAPKNSRLRLVRAQPGATPLDLTRATVGAGLSASWPRVAPFAQRNGSLIFFTFSARMRYGHSQPSQNQVWMAGVDLAEAAKNPMGDPSFAPFWVPFQGPNEDNHLATWTTDVACIKKADCPAEFDCVNGQCVPGLG